MPSRLRGLPIFWATLLLLLAVLLAQQALTAAMILFLDAPRPEFNRLSDVADALAGREHERGHRERVLIVSLRRAPPAPAAGMVADPGFTAMLADRLGVTPASVRLWFDADQRADVAPGTRRRRRLVPIRRGEPIFFDTLVAGVDTGRGWRVARTPPRPWLAGWQWGIVWWFLACVTMLVPFAWAFARRLTRPIRRFAAAADRMGRDPLSPPVPEEGPAELRVTAHALNHMQERLAAYVAERTAMIGAIAHDLRTPLARIAFRIEAAPEPLRDKVQADVEQMRAMIAATIGFVRGTTPGESAPVALDALVTRAAEAEQDLGRPVKVGALAAVTLMGDALALQRLLQNLIDNGVHYGGGVTLSLTREGAEAVLTVADEGPGLPPGRVERLFDPFERGDPSRNRETGGIGLGLTIARSIAGAHGGTLSLRNRTGGGAEAILRLPCRDAQSRLK